MKDWLTVLGKIFGIYVTACFGVYITACFIAWVLCLFLN